QINLMNREPPTAQTFIAATYRQIKNETVETSSNTMLTSLIKSTLKNTRVMVFINNKDRIQSIARQLRRDNIKVATVTSDNKQSATYKQIVESETIPDDIEVILTTVVLSSGITIRNNAKWSIIVSSESKLSPIFNPSTIRQISHRFRNSYNFFI